jgi:hypothetical protein
MGLLLDRLFGDEKAEHRRKLEQQVKRSNDLKERELNLLEREVHALEALAKQGLNPQKGVQ